VRALLQEVAARWVGGGVIVVGLFALLGSGMDIVT
jgi:hypothetical protein